MAKLLTFLFTMKHNYLYLLIISIILLGCKTDMVHPYGEFCACHLVKRGTTIGLSCPCPNIPLEIHR